MLGAPPLDLPLSWSPWLRLRCCVLNDIVRAALMPVLSPVQSKTINRSQLQSFVACDTDVREGVVIALPPSLKP